MQWRIHSLQSRASMLPPTLNSIIPFLFASTKNGYKKTPANICFLFNFMLVNFMHDPPILVYLHILSKILFTSWLTNISTDFLNKPRKKIYRQVNTNFPRQVVWLVLLINCLLNFIQFNMLLKISSEIVKIKEVVNFKLFD